MNFFVFKIVLKQQQQPHILTPKHTKLKKKLVHILFYALFLLFYEKKMNHLMKGDFASVSCLVKMYNMLLLK